MTVYDVVVDEGVVENVYVNPPSVVANAVGATVAAAVKSEGAPEVVPLESETVKVQTTGI